MNRDLFSVRRYRVTEKPHIFKAGGVWRVSYRKLQWTHEAFCHWIDATNFVYTLNNPPAKEALMRAQPKWNS